MLSIFTTKEGKKGFLFKVQPDEFFVINYQNIVEAVNHDQHTQRSITAKTDGLM